MSFLADSLVAALQAAIHKHGHKWITAISVGSEDLYRGNTDPNTLAGQIHDVRGMVRAMGVHAPVGHVDTWTAWVNHANDATTRACDFIGMDGVSCPFSLSLDFSRPNRSLVSLLPRCGYQARQKSFLQQLDRYS